MRKTLFGLWAMICAICFFTACSDDDDSGNDVRWQDLSKTYDGRNIKLVLGENIVPIAGKSVAVNASSETAAEITLNNLLPERPAVTVPAALQATEKAFAFAGKTNVDGTDVTIEGTIEKGVLSMVMKRNLQLPVVGDWKLRYTKVSANPAAVVYTNVKTGNPQVDGMVQMMAGPVIGQLLAKKVDAVQVNFRTSGTLGISWKKVGEEQTSSIDNLLEVVNLQYCRVNDRFFLVIDKNFVEVVTSLGKELLAQKGISVEALMNLLTDLGGYYGLPLQVTTHGDSATFYADKQLILPVITLVMPLLESKIPEGLEEMVKSILTLLPTAERVDLGLTFER